jgi:hypothetical protein
MLFCSTTVSVVVIFIGVCTGSTVPNMKSIARIVVIVLIDVIVFNYETPKLHMI